MPWVADGVEDKERETAQHLVDLGVWYPETFSALMQKPWVGDSITADETIAIYSLRWMAKYAPEIADGLLQRIWLNDDVNWQDASAVQYHYWMGRYAPELTGIVVRKSWLEDGVSRDEVTVIRYLYRLLRSDDADGLEDVVNAVFQLLEMPFLDSVTGADALTLRSFDRLERNNREYFLEVMSHPSVSDGITNEEAQIFPLLGATYEKNPSRCQCYSMVQESIWRNAP